jgi:hypothetical protein
MPIADLYQVIDHAVDIEKGQQPVFCRPFPFATNPFLAIVAGGETLDSSIYILALADSHEGYNPAFYSHKRLTK